MLGLVVVPRFEDCERSRVVLLTSLVLFPWDTVPLREVPTVPLEVPVFLSEVPTRFEVVPSDLLRLDTLEPVLIRPFASRLTAVDPLLLVVAFASLRLELPVLELNLSRLTERTEE